MSNAVFINTIVDSPPLEIFIDDKSVAQLRSYTAQKTVDGVPVISKMSIKSNSKALLDVPLNLSSAKNIVFLTGDKNNPKDLNAIVVNLPLQNCATDKYNVSFINLSDLDVPITGTITALRNDDAMPEMLAIEVEKNDLPDYMELSTDIRRLRANADIGKEEIEKKLDRLLSQPPAPGSILTYYLTGNEKAGYKLSMHTEMCESGKTSTTPSQNQPGQEQTAAPPSTGGGRGGRGGGRGAATSTCLLYTSDAADDM
jgi:hypothetical protein